MEIEEREQRARSGRRRRRMWRREVVVRAISWVWVHCRQGFSAVLGAAGICLAAELPLQGENFKNLAREWPLLCQKRSRRRMKCRDEMFSSFFLTEPVKHDVSGRARQLPERRLHWKQGLVE